MSALPRIRLEPSGIEVVHLRPAQMDICTRHGERYHLSDECLREIAALWGVEPHHGRINDAGVFTPFDTVIDIGAGRCRAEILMACSPSGLWAMDTSYMTAMSGGGSAPSVWNPIAFLCEADARAAGLNELIARFRAIAAEGGSDATDARNLADLLCAERTPQLSLF